MDPVVILGTDVVSVGPGQEQRLPVRVRNQGRRVESYHVDVVGIPGQFAEVRPDQVSVLPGREAELDVIFRPPGGSSTPTGTVPFAVRATSQVDATASAVAEGRLELAGMAGLQAWTHETIRTARWSTSYHLEFANEGNAAVRVALSAYDPAGATRLRVEPDVIDLTAGGRATATIEAKSRQPFLRGSTVVRAIQADCQTFPFGAARPTPGGVPPVDDPNYRTFRLTFQQRAILPKFVLPLIVAAVAVGLALAVVTLRRTTAVSLDLAAPLAPGGPVATPNGSDGVLLNWTLVPNAVGYEVRQQTVNGQQAEDVLADDLPADASSYPVSGLLPQTEYCFAVRALGADDRDGALSAPMCATTSATASLPTPQVTSADPVGDDQYEVRWTYTGTASNDLVFTVFVTGQPPTVVAGADMFTTVTIEQKADVQELAVRVSAELGDDESGLSKPFPLSIPALPPPTTAPETTAAPATTATTAPGDTTTTATTAPATTTTTPSLVAAGELDNLDETWVAMLGPVSAASIGGLTEDARKERLANDFSLPLDDVDVFSNRDTFVTEVDGRRSIINDRPASNRYVYFPTGDDQALAVDICTRGATCQVLKLVGAARSTEGTRVALVGQLAADATLAELDADLDARRAASVGPRIYAVDGVDYPGLDTSRVVVFVTGFPDDSDAAGFCAASPTSGCRAVDLGLEQ